MQLISGSINSINITWINDKDDSLSIGVIVAPETTDLVLTSNIPNSEGHIFVLDRFYVKTDRWDGGDDYFDERGYGDEWARSSYHAHAIEKNQAHPLRTFI